MPFPRLPPVPRTREEVGSKVRSEKEEMEMNERTVCCGKDEGVAKTPL